MKTSTEHITTTHVEDLQVKSDITFYKEELFYLRKRLNEVSSKNTAKDVKMLVSHFENQFIIQREVLDELEHDVQRREDRIAMEVRQNPVAFEHKTLPQYTDLKGQMEMFRKLYAEMKKEFNRFLSENM